MWSGGLPIKWTSLPFLPPFTKSFLIWNYPLLHLKSTTSLRLLSFMMIVLCISYSPFETVCRYEWRAGPGARPTCCCTTLELAPPSTIPRDPTTSQWLSDFLQPLPTLRDSPWHPLQHFGSVHIISPPHYFYEWLDSLLGDGLGSLGYDLFISASVTYAFRLASAGEISLFSESDVASASLECRVCSLVLSHPNVCLVSCYPTLFKRGWTP